MIINLGQHEYCAALSASLNMACTYKQGEFGQGIIEKPELIGRLGEQAIGHALGEHIDAAWYKHGDSGDFNCGKYTLDVKTHAKPENHGEWNEGIFRRYTDSGVEIPLSCDIYAFAEIITHSIEDKTAIVNLVGYITRPELLKVAKTKDARRGNHKNWTVLYQHLKPIEILIGKWRENK